MPKSTENTADTPLEPLIFSIRGHRVILDAELALLYGVTTKSLNQALKRNADRFPPDFAFQLVPEEMKDSMWSQIVTTSKDTRESSRKSLWNRSQLVTGSADDDRPPMRSQFVTASQEKRNQRFLPWVFTEHGALMAATILRSDRAVQMSLYVVRAFVKLRQVVLENEAMTLRMAEAELALREHDAALLDIYDKLEPLLDHTPEPPPPQRSMGFRQEAE